MNHTYFFPPSTLRRRLGGRHRCARRAARDAPGGPPELRPAARQRCSRRATRDAPGGPPEMRPAGRQRCARRAARDAPGGPPEMRPADRQRCARRTARGAPGRPSSFKYSSPPQATRYNSDFPSLPSMVLFRYGYDLLCNLFAGQDN
jgi:hypothetical protein